MFSSRFMLFPTLKKKKWCKKKNSGGGGGKTISGGGGGGVEKKNVRRILRFMLFSTLKKNTIEKVPLHLMVKWEVVSPNSRYGQWESIYLKKNFFKISCFLRVSCYFQHLKNKK